MSSLSSILALPYMAVHRPHSLSEEARPSSAIGDGVAGGTVAADATALAGANDANPSSGGSPSGEDGSTSSGARLDPSKIEDRIDGLIADQVSSGSLTGDQATALKGLFAAGGHGTKGFDGTGDATGIGGPPPDPPPGPPTSGHAASNDSTGADTTGDGSAPSAADLLAAFIHQLQSSQANAYAARGTSGTGSRASALLFDFET